MHIRKFMPEYMSAYKVPVETLLDVRLDGFRGTVGRSKLAGETVVEHYEDIHRIFITLEGQTRSTTAEIDRLPTVRRPDRPGAVTVVPAGVKRRVILEDPDFLILSLWVTDTFLNACADDDGPAQTPPILQNVRNHWSLRLANAFRHAGLGGASAMEMQTLAFAMLRHLTRSQGRLSESGGLDPLALGRVLELMQDRLAENLTLTELAAEAGLGVSAFSRAFAKSVGASPYRYFAGARMQKAKELLAQGTRPLAEIAGETGYADQAHFTAAFTRYTGYSPGKWRSAFGTVPGFLPISRKTAISEPA
jgi:AraC family transcriptional regulator